MVTHPSTNQFWRSATTLIKANALPLSQTVYGCTLIKIQHLLTSIFQFWQKRKQNMEWQLFLPKTNKNKKWEVFYVPRVLITKQEVYIHVAVGYKSDFALLLNARE